MGKTTDNLIGAVNGAFGNLLAENNNPLAQQMTIYFGGHPLNEIAALENALTTTKSRSISILVHGLGNTEHIWDFPAKTEQDNSTQKLHTASDDYGIRLSNTFGILPLLLRYNTGLNIADNAAQLDQLLSDLATKLKDDIDRIVLIGFSMGGLVSRLAQGIASKNNFRSPWLTKLEKAIYIGTPHEGAPLEKAVHKATQFVEKIPKTYVSIWGTQANLRSQGIKDLGLKNSDLGEYPFSEHCEHLFISGCLWKQNQILPNWLFGDSLVRQDSACPSDMPKNSKAIDLYGINHIRMAHSERVWTQIQTWLAASYDPVSKDDSSQSASCLHSDASAIPLKPTPIQAKSAQLIGSINAFSHAGKHIVQLTESMQGSIAEEPFRILNRLPMINSVSKPVETIYATASSSIYSALHKAFDTTSSLSKSKKND